MREPSSVAGRKVPRRRFLQAGAASALLLGGAAIAAVRTRGYSLPPGRKLTATSPWEYAVVQHAARRIAAPDREGDASIPTADDLHVAGFVDRWLGQMPARVRRDLGRFLAYLEHVAPVRVGFASRFTRLAPPDQDQVLSSVERSSSELLRAGFDGIKSLVFLGYYSDVRTWGILGYDGPLVGRPPTGWR